MRSLAPHGASAIVPDRMSFRRSCGRPSRPRGSLERGERGGGPPGFTGGDTCPRVPPCTRARAGVRHSAGRPHTCTCGGPHTRPEQQVRGVRCRWVPGRDGVWPNGLLGLRSTRPARSLAFARYYPWAGRPRRERGLFDREERPAKDAQQRTLDLRRDLRHLETVRPPKEFSISCR
jgi:hypothetical protein